MDLFRQIWRVSERVRRRTSKAPLGRWETPASGRRLPRGVVTISGWAVAGRGERKLEVSVLVDGALRATERCELSRPELAAVYGRLAEDCGWAVRLDLCDAPSLAVVEVVVSDGVERRSLGRRRVQMQVLSTKRQPLRGWLEHPADGMEVVGTVIPVRGWCVAGGDHAEAIDVYVDDAEPVRARRCDDRHDLVEAGIAPPGIAVAAGFSALIPVPRVRQRMTSTVRVVARMSDGTHWTPQPVRVTFAPEPAAAPSLHTRWPHLGREASAREQREGLPRVAVITHSLNLGGGELYLQELLLRMARDRVAEFYLMSPTDGPLRAELEAAGVVVQITAPYGVDVARYGARLAELGALMSSEHFDVVIANTAGVFPAVDSALDAGLPVVWAIHESFDIEVFSYLNWGPDGLDGYVRQRWMATLARSNAVVFESEATRLQWEAQVPGLTGRCIRYGIDLAQIAAYEARTDRDRLRAEAGFDADDRVLLCMGVFQERKAQLALVHAFAGVAVTAPHLKLVLVGEHPCEYAAAVRLAVNDLGLSDAVRIEPINPDTYRWYRTADVLVSASDTESLPRSVLEAMGFGVPVLAVDVFGLSEVIVDGRNGWLCSERNAAALSTGLLRVAGTDEGELAARSKQCRADARAFDGSHYAAEYAGLIRDLASGAST